MKRNFAFVGGHPILDFCNTIFIHSNSMLDLFESKADIERWSKDLSLQHKIDFTHLDLSVEVASQLRTLLRSLFESAILAKSSTTSLKKLNTIFHNHPITTHVEFSEELTFSFVPGQFSNQGIAWLQIQLQDFLLKSQPHRLKKCENPNCSHLFYDKSKSATRTWCSMSGCGNVMKSRKFRNGLKSR
ncbi:MAG: CGNR zinc finger domain-containing protein [Bacteriovoracaceae bacterium]|nr:CGNR zinc finger domain-containing protein [Bacteriovoracaceae bacterium]